jgi:hypothetical protein
MDKFRVSQFPAEGETGVMKHLISQPVGPDRHHDARNALELLAGATVLACVFWLHPLWAAVAIFAAGVPAMFFERIGRRSNTSIERKHPYENRKS